MDTYTSLNNFLKDFPQEEHLRSIIGTSTHTRVVPADGLFLDEHFLLYITVTDDFYEDEVWCVNTYAQYGGCPVMCLEFDSLSWALRELNTLVELAPLSVETLEDRGYVQTD